MAIRLAACATHPIQVQVPLFRELAACPDIDLQVFYANDDNTRPTYNPAFGVTVEWDTPILEGYSYRFLQNRAPLSNAVVDPGMVRRLFSSSAPQIRQHLVQGQFDALLVPGYTRLFYLQAIEGARRAGAAVLFRGNNRDETGGRRPRLREAVRNVALKGLYRRIDAFLSVGKYMRRHFRQFGVAEERIFDTPYCIDDRLFADQRERFLPQRDAIRSELGIPPGAVALLYSGKISPKKAPGVLAAALCAVGRRDDLHVIVMGDGPLRAEFEEKVRPVLGDHLKMLGFINQSQVGRYHAASDALVLCSDYGESWGLVVNEAMTFGRPSLVSDGVGCREDLVLEGETGFVFPRGDSGRLAEHIHSLLADRELLTAMGRNAEERIKSFSVARNVEGIREALEVVVPRSSSRSRRARANRSSRSVRPGSGPLAQL